MRYHRVPCGLCGESRIDPTSGYDICYRCNYATFAGLGRYLRNLASGHRCMAPGCTDVAYPQYCPRHQHISLELWAQLQEVRYGI